MKASEDSLFLFSHDVSVAVLYQLMRFAPDVQEVENDHSFFLSRRYAHLRGKASRFYRHFSGFFVEDCRDTVGAHSRKMCHEKMYHDAFTDFLSKAASSSVAKYPGVFRYGRRQTWRVVSSRWPGKKLRPPINSVKKLW